MYNYSFGCDTGVIIHLPNWLLGVTGLASSTASPRPHSFSANTWKTYWDPSSRLPAVISQSLVTPIGCHVRRESSRFSTVYRVIGAPPVDEGLSHFRVTLSASISVIFRFSTGPGLSNTTTCQSKMRH